MSTKTKKTVARKKGKAKGKRATKGKEKVPSAQDLIRAGLAAGETNEEIRDRVLKVHPDSKIQKNPTGWVGWTIGQERKKGSPWWQEHGKKVAEDRGVAPTAEAT
jgi:hypothetical protein